MSNSGFSNNSVLGQFTDEVVGELKGVATDTVKQIAIEPKKILESILGTAKADQKTGGEQGIEDLIGGSQGVNGNDPNLAGNNSLLIKRQIEDRESSTKQLELHRLRLREAEEFYEKEKQKKEVEEQQMEQEEEQKEQEEIVQLQRRSGDIQQNQQLHGRLGSKEFDKQTQ